MMTSLDINILHQEQVSRSAEGFKCSMLLFVFPLKAVFTLGFLPSVSPVQLLFHKKSLHILSYLFLSFLLFFLFAIPFLSGKKCGKERRNEVSNEGGKEGREEGWKEGR